MSSILTNTSSMVALQTLKSTNKGMAQIQNQISTGLKVSTAKDNASTWAIAQTMRADVSGFKAIKSGLDVAGATVNVARNAAESISDLLQEVKSKVVESQSESVDRTKIQADIVQLREQIESVVNTAQFNGRNLLNGSGDMSVLGALDRGQDQTVSTGTIQVAGQDLRVGEMTRLTGAAQDRLTWGTGGELAAGGTDTLTVANVAEGDVYRLTIGSTTRSFTAGADDTADSMASKIAGALSGGDITASVTAGAITFTNNGANALVLEEAAFEADAAGVGGGLGALASFDVSTAAGAASALEQVEGLISAAADAASSLGSYQKRIEIQQDFMTKLTDSMNTGIGSMVDADMEEASARLQALQVQQQLGVQALSMANQAPQALLSLFR